MGWTRYGQLSGETQSLANVAGLDGSGYAVSNTVAFTGAWSYRTSGTNAPLGFAGALGVSARCAMQFRHNGGSGTNIPIVGFLVDGATLLWRFDSTNNDVTLYAGYTANSSTRSIPVIVNVPVIADLNTWRHVAMTAYLAASGGFVSLYVDGVQVAEWTGDTRLYRANETTSRTSITGIYAAGPYNGWPGGVAGSTWTNYVYIDDFYADAWTGESAPTDAPVPTRRFLAVYPSGAGASSDWTPSAGANWENVDEAPPDDGTTFNTATAPGALDLYAYAGVTVPEGYAVRSVIPMAYGLKSDAGTDSRVKLVITDGVDTAESEAIPLPTSYGYVWQRWELQPDGETAWDQAAVNAAQRGHESDGTF